MLKWIYAFFVLIYSSHTDTILYMVMEKGDSDLHHILQSYTSELPLFRLMQFWYEMLQAVHYIHQNGVIHSDLKPANFLMVNGRLKLIDFGIASNISTDSTSIIKHSQAGTFNYISPEALIDTSTGDSPPSKSQPKIKVNGCLHVIARKFPYSFHFSHRYQLNLTYGLWVVSYIICCTKRRRLPISRIYMQKSMP